MKHILSLAVLLATAAPAFAGTSTPTRVVELFTSQGCSSCPPANGFVVGLADSSPDTLALSYGVTYWDYLGWKDTFGDPAFTERQRYYRDALGSNMYTPQMVVNGTEHAPRWRKNQVEAHDLAGRAELREVGGSLALDGEFPAGAKLALVSYTPGTQDVAVKRGENHGRKLTLSNVVTDVRYADWTGEAFVTPMPKTALAVLVHDGSSGELIAAADYRP